MRRINFSIQPPERIRKTNFFHFNCFFEGDEKHPLEIIEAFFVRFVQSYKHQSNIPVVSPNAVDLTEVYKGAKEETSQNENEPVVNMARKGASDFGEEKKNLNLENLNSLTATSRGLTPPVEVENSAIPTALGDADGKEPGLSNGKDGESEDCKMVSNGIEYKVVFAGKDGEHITCVSTVSALTIL